MKSKKQLKTIGMVIIFIVLFIVIFLRISEIFCRKTIDGPWNYTQKISGFYNSPKNEYDIMFFGSSNTYCSFNPLVIYDEIGVKSYVLATQNQPVWASYTYIKEALKTQKPKLVVMDILAFSYTEEYGDEGVNHSYMDDLPFSSNKVELALSSTPDKKKQLELLVNFIKYHSRWNELSKSDFTFDRSKARDYLKGYVLLEQTYDKAQLPQTSTRQMMPIQKKQAEYFEKIVNLAKKQNIKLLLVKTPSNVSEENQMYFNTIEQMAKEENVEYVDFNRKYDEMNIDIKADFFDKSHLNYKGAEKFSRYFANEVFKIYSNFSLKDRNNTDKVWKSDFKKYLKYCETIENN